MPRVRRFEFVGGASAKFWEISHNDAAVTVRFGRLGTHGQTQTKYLGSETAAAFHVVTLIKEKLAKGYVEVSGTDQPPAGSAAGRIDFSTGITRPPVLPPYEVPPIPGDGPVDIESVRLPPGRRLQGDPSGGPPGIETILAPVVWLTDAPVADSGGLLYRLRGPSAGMGLVPVLLTGMEADETRPWDSHEFSPTDPRRADHFDPRQVLADMWSESLEQEDEESLDPVQPFGLEFPGLAAAPAVNPPSGFGRLFAKPSDTTDDRAALASLRSRRIGLVAVKRPADAITALGWSGAVNVHQDPALMSAVLRSWEDRWAARVVEIGFATLTLTVGIPPSDGKAALALAAEHFAFCPDNIWQGEGTLVAYAKSLEQSRIWTFWWD
jgi:predicted DNA-binding WGR domain protein